MLLPASYANGFAPRDGQPLYPEMWRGCVGAWNPGLGVSGLTLRDQSGFQNNGTLINGPTWAASGGKYAMSFDGTDDYARVGTATTFNTNSKWTWFAWFNRSTAGVSSVFGDGDGFARVVWSDATSLYVSNDGNSYLLQTFTTSLNAWINITLVSRGDSTNVDVYRNGVLNGTYTNGGSFTFRDIGRGYTLYYWAGLIDDVRIYNRALSPNEIRTLATRRGIAYEMASRRRSSVQVTVAPLRYNLFSGSIGNTDVIGAS